MIDRPHHELRARRVRSIAIAARGPVHDACAVRRDGNRSIDYAAAPRTQRRQRKRRRRRDHKSRDLRTTLIQSHDLPRAECRRRDGGDHQRRACRRTAPARRRRDRRRLHDRRAERARIFERELHGGDVADAALAIFHETSAQHEADGRRELLRQLRPVRFLRQHERERVRDVLAFKRPSGGQHLVEHAAERPDVAALVGGTSLRLFRRHVRRRAENGAEPGHHRRRRDRRRRGHLRTERRWRVHRFCEAEIEDFDRAVRTQLDIGRLQIAMDDALFVRGLERIGDLLRDSQRFGERERPLRNAIGQRWALDELEHQRVDAAAVLEAVDRSDVRMVE